VYEKYSSSKNKRKITLPWYDIIQIIQTNIKFIFNESDKLYLVYYFSHRIVRYSITISILNLFTLPFLSFFLHFLH